MRRIRRFLPFTWGGLAIWAWRNRQALTAWGAFGLGSLRRMGASDRSDLIAEARLRAALAMNERTRGVSSLDVEVRKGTAILSGAVTPETRQIATSIAQRTKGVHRIEDRTQERASRSWFGARRRTGAGG